MKTLAKIFAGIGKGGLAVALWASQHQDIIQMVTTIALQAQSRAAAASQVKPGQ